MRKERQDKGGGHITSWTFFGLPFLSSCTFYDVQEVIFNQRVHQQCSEDWSCAGFNHTFLHCRWICWHTESRRVPVTKPSLVQNLNKSIYLLNFDYRSSGQKANSSDSYQKSLFGRCQSASYETVISFMFYPDSSRSYSWLVIESSPSHHFKFGDNHWKNVHCWCYGIVVVK